MDQSGGAMWCIGGFLTRWIIVDFGELENVMCQRLGQLCLTQIPNYMKAASFTKNNNDSHHTLQQIGYLIACSHSSFEKKP